MAMSHIVDSINLAVIGSASISMYLCHNIPGDAPCGPQAVLMTRACSVGSSNRNGLMLEKSKSFRCIKHVIHLISNVGFIQLQGLKVTDIKKCNLGWRKHMSFGLYDIHTQTTYSFN